MASPDVYAAYAAAPSAPARRLEAVAPSDTVDLPTSGKALYVGVAGDLRIVPVASPDGVGITLKNHPVGYVAVQVRRVFATGTTAGQIVALFD